MEHLLEGGQLGFQVGSLGAKARGVGGGRTSGRGRNLRVKVIVRSMVSDGDLRMTKSPPCKRRIQEGRNKRAQHPHQQTSLPGKVGVSGVIPQISLHPINFQHYSVCLHRQSKVLDDLVQRYGHDHPTSSAYAPECTSPPRYSRR